MRAFRRSQSLGLVYIGPASRATASIIPTEDPLSPNTGTYTLHSGRSHAVSSKAKVEEVRWDLCVQVYVMNMLLTTYYVRSNTAAGERERNWREMETVISNWLGRISIAERGRGRDSSTQSVHSNSDVEAQSYRTKCWRSFPCNFPGS